MSSYYQRILKSKVIRMYFEDFKSVDQIIKELNEPSLRQAYYWVKEYKSMRRVLPRLTKSELEQLVGIKPSKGFKTIKEEVETLRLGAILPALIDELKKKGKII